MKIEGKTAIVSGAASGLGAGTAAALAELGARIIRIDQNGEGLAASPLSDAVDIQGDVADADSMEAGIKAAIAKVGNPSILVNCAGIATGKRVVGREGPIALGEFERVIRVNLIGSFNLMRLAAAAMVENEPNEDGERGVIISTSSVAAFEGQIGQAAYSASKGGVAALTIPVARELASKGIRVMAIAPGLFGTPMLLNMPQEVQDSLAATVPFPTRFGTSEEYAGLVRHIVENPMLNGEVIRIDGAIRLAAR